MLVAGRDAPPPFVRLVGHPLRWRLLVELARSDRRVRELVTVVDEPQNLVSYHLRQLRSGGLVTSRRSSFDGRDSYYHLDLDRCAQALTDTGAALHPALDTPRSAGVPPMSDRPDRPAVLFLCTGNSARSPMAAALLRHRSGGLVDAASAGSHPKPAVHPDAVRVMRADYGLDVSAHRPTNLADLAGRRFDFVISLCDKVREVCPEPDSDAELVHWSLPDPAAVAGSAHARYTAFRDTAAELDTRIRFLLPVLAHRTPLEVQS